MTYIIAEAGSNHNGNVNLAFKLVDVAKNAGAHFIKFQIINPKTLYVPYYWDGDKKEKNIVYERRLNECLTKNEWRKVYEYSKKVGIQFTASIFDEDGVDFLKELGVPFIKLASSDLNNKGLIQYVAKSKIPLIISSGMSTIEEVKMSLNAYCEYNSIDKLTVLHCVSVYPCQLENTALEKLKLLQKELNCKIGFSDHTMNSKAACVAASMGVSYIEKHFTIDKEMDGFDHKYASSPEEFKEYIKDINAINKSLKKTTELSNGEDITKIRARRGVYLNKPLERGSIVRKEDLDVVRPSNKLNPFDLEKLIGIKVNEDIREYEPMELKKNGLYVDRSNKWKAANNYWTNEMKEKKMS